MQSRSRRTALLAATLGAAAASLPLAAGAQTQLSRAEAAQMYTAAGFTIANDRPLNACGQPARPRVTMVDVNGDKRAEALFIDESTQCYAPSGRYFALLVNEGGRWRAVISGKGQIQARASRSAGWLDMQVTEAGCTRDFRYAGSGYAAASTCAGESLATAAPQPPGKARATTTAPAPATEPAAAAPGADQVPAKLSAADEAAAFKTAGFTKRGGAWRNCDDPSAGASPGSVEQVADLNGDGRPEVLLTEGGTFCYGHTGTAYWLVSQQAGGGWKLVTHNTGIAQFLKTTGAGGWPDISVGGPGFCFPVERWNGREYRQQRWEYEGKPCKPPR